jgi:anaerobic ribonucleoside-triphosphate reductase activating protein
MKYLQYRLVFQELPGSISLAFWITGCDVHCPDCNSKELWEDVGTLLTPHHYIEILNKYRHFIDCVIFFGGEWNSNELIELLKITHIFNLKTNLWTGRNDVIPEIKNELDYLKTGMFKKELGDLYSKTTNQKYFDLKTNTEIKFNI